MDEHVFFPEISTMFLCILCSVLLWYSSLVSALVTDLLLWLHHIFFSDYLMQFFVLFPITFLLATLFPYFPNYPQSSMFVLFSFRLLVFVLLMSAANLMSLNFAHCCSTFSASPKTKFRSNSHTMLLLEGLVGF